MTALLLLVLALAGPDPAPARDGAGAAGLDPATHDPAALQVLSETAAAYRALKTLEQESTYDAVAGARAADTTRVSLMMSRPNRLLLRVWRRVPMSDQATETRVLCDGKRVWTWLEEPGSYSEEKAPRDLKGFRNRIACLELSLLAEADPFPEMARRARSVRLAPAEEVEGVPVDVVVFDLSDDLSTGAARVSVGARDRLVRAFAFTSRPRPRPIHNEDGTVSPPEPMPPSGMAYRSVLRLDTRPAKGVFEWVPPRGAFKAEGYPTLGSLDEYLARNRASARRERPTTPTGQKTITLDEFIKRSRKKR